MLKAQIEAILFSAAKPLKVSQITKLVLVSHDEVIQAIEELMAERNIETSGLHIVHNDHAYAIVTNPVHAEVVSSFHKEEASGELTRPQLETLTIVCYRGPLTKGEIEEIRGVNCSLILRNLMIRGLVEEFDHKERLQPMYRVTVDLVRSLGIQSVSELPEYNFFQENEELDTLLQKNEGV